jgi:hypothetical protein
VLDEDLDDPFFLDADNDGIACEELPHRPVAVGAPVAVVAVARFTG